MKVEVSPAGQITEVKGHQSILDKAGSAGSGLTKRDFAESAAELAVLLVDGEPDGPGSEWAHAFTWNHPMGTLHVDSHYELKRIKTIADVPVAVVRRSSELRVEPDLSKLPADAPSVGVKTKRGEQTTEILFDLSRHEVVGRHMRRRLDVETTLEAGDRTVRRIVEERAEKQVLRLSED